MIKLVPIDFKADQTPLDEKLHAAAVAYSEQQFGEPTNFRWYSRSWAVLSVREDEPEYFEVMGLLGCRNTVDFQLFHTTPISQDREGMKQVHEARDAMIARGKAFCSDSLYMTGQSVLVYVSSEAERYWRGFLKKIKAKQANRYTLEI